MLYFVISDFPEEASWLTQDEKEFVKARLQDDIGQSGHDRKIQVVDFLVFFKDCASFPKLICRYVNVDKSFTLIRQNLPGRFDLFWTHSTCV